MDTEATSNSTKNFPSFPSHMLERRLYFSSFVNHPGLAVSRFVLWQNTQIPNSVLKISISQTLHRNHLSKKCCMVSSLKVLLTLNMTRQIS